MNTPRSAAARAIEDHSAARWAQSLGDGAPGIALEHIARARAGLDGWEPVHRLARAMTRSPVDAHPDTASLYQGAPAVAYALHAAAHPAYRSALTTLDRAVFTVIEHRLDTANRRIDHGGQLPRAREYDLINGLTGLGVYLLHRGHTDELLHGVLTYLVRLTLPVHVNGRSQPGWWAIGSPDRRHAPRWQAGHAGFGLAHGIAGPLALLAIAMRRDIAVAGQVDALHTLLAWFDAWRSGVPAAASWPEVIDQEELHAGSAAQPGPYRPSWCYGTPGIARAQQLAALAVGDQRRARDAVGTLQGCLTNDQQLASLADAGLCHGWTGLLLTAHRAAVDGGSVELTAAVGAARRRVTRPRRGDPHDAGFLTGTAGTMLAEATLDAAAGLRLPGWDRCLLIGDDP